MWEDRSLNCYYNLCEWGEVVDNTNRITQNRLYNNNNNNNPEDFSLLRLLLSDNNNSNNDSRLRERHLPLYLESMLQLGDNNNNNNNNNNELFDFFTRILSSDKKDENSEASRLKNWVKQLYPAEIAVFLLQQQQQQQQWGKMLLLSGQALEGFLHSWSSIHPCSYEVTTTIILIIIIIIIIIIISIIITK